MWRRAFYYTLALVVILVPVLSCGGAALNFKFRDGDENRLAKRRPDGRLNSFGVNVIRTTL